MSSLSIVTGLLFSVTPFTHLRCHICLDKTLESLAGSENESGLESRHIRFGTTYAYVPTARISPIVGCFEIALLRAPVVDTEARLSWNSL
jgi:hypothetical protein